MKVKLITARGIRGETEGGKDGDATCGGTHGCGGGGGGGLKQRADIAIAEGL